MIRIQPFDPAQGEQVAQLIIPIQQQEFAIGITYADQPDLHDIKASYQKGSGGFWVAVDEDDAVVGSIGLLDIGERMGALRKMFVASDYRGQPHRTAQRLLEALLDHAAGKALQAIYLGTTDKYHAAHRFYEKNGFDRVDPDALPANFPRMAVDSIFYKIQPGH